MQYHYVVSYDDQTRKWKLENGEGWFDGNVWDEDDSEFSWPRDEREEMIDERAHTMLNTLASIWPEVYDGES